MDDLIFKGATGAFSRNLDLREMPLCDIGVLNSEFHPVYPNANYKTSDSPLEFVISGSSSQYTDLRKTFLHLTIKIVSSTDDKDLPATPTITGVEGFYAALFEGCEIQLNNTQITKSAPSLYNYKYFLETLLSGSSDAKESALQNELFYRDSDPDKFTANSNANFKKRASITGESKSFELVGRISDSLTNQNKYIPNNVEIKIILRRSSPQFALCGPAVTAGIFPYKIKITNAVLWVQRHTIHPKLLHEYNTIASGTRFNFPFVQNEIRSFQIPSGSLTYNSSSLYLGAIPSKIVIGLVSAKAFSGSIDTSPFHFQDFKLASMVLTCDGDSMMYRQLEINTANNSYLMALNSLLSIYPAASGGNGICRENFSKGNCLFAIDLLPSVDKEGFHVVRNGQIKLELKFRAATSEAVVAICMGTFQYLCQIDRDRNIYSDATVI